MARYQVAPSAYGTTYRNPHFRHLLMLAEGVADKYKAIHTDAADSPIDHKVYFVDTDQYSVPDGVESIDKKQFRFLAKAQTDWMSDQDIPHKFMHDAAVGSNRAAEMRTRTLMESGNHALYLRHLLCSSRLSGYGGVQLWSSDWIVYISHNYKSENPLVERDQTPESIGIKNGPFHVINPDKRIVLLGASQSTASIKHCLDTLQTFHYLYFEKDALPLHAHTFVKNGVSSLVIDPSQVMLQQAPRGDMYGASGAIWKHEGVYRSYASVTHSDAEAPRKRGDFVENNPQGTFITTPLPDGEASFVEHPKSVVIMLRDTTGAFPLVSRIDQAQAEKMFKVGFTGNKDPASNTPYYYPSSTAYGDVAESRFKSLLTSYKPQVYVVNVVKDKKGTEISTADRNALLDAILDGSAAEATATKNASLKAEVISKLGSLDAKLFKGFGTPANTKSVLSKHGL
eukprot:CAMPEP_0168518968 /NCGR_PEP_ID=MMETSP0405-20121227/7038_1 /TAXON_ID=498012 /ORGANISM="Trichosphaerium sp, Strain Am-I-7 wt" /LENGTH=454 /DNA_ID=CAMNT_0008539421 /DNA_START=211 /DNA_END=1575 /DNA_ORIENTATION=-